jgi:hypothetical protein
MKTVTVTVTVMVTVTVKRVAEVTVTLPTSHLRVTIRGLREAISLPMRVSLSLVKRTAMARISQVDVRLSHPNLSRVNLRIKSQS